MPSRVYGCAVSKYLRVDFFDRYLYIKYPFTEARRDFYISIVHSYSMTANGVIKRFSLFDGPEKMIYD